MAFIKAQIIGVIGYATLLLNRIKNQVQHYGDPNIDQTSQNASNHDALQALDSLQILMNTVYTALNRTKPTTTYTLQQLQNLGVF